MGGEQTLKLGHSVISQVADRNGKTVIWARVLKHLGLKTDPHPRWERADHYLERMSRDPEWVRREQEREAKRQARQLALEHEEAPLLSDLANVGITGLKSVYDFVNMPETPPAAFEVLLDHLERPYDPIIREGIARALTDKQAKGIAGPALLRQLARKPRDNEVCRGAFANALTIVATRQDAIVIKQLLEEEEDEFIRRRLALALKRAQRSRGTAASA